MSGQDKLLALETVAFWISLWPGFLKKTAARAAGGLILSFSRTKKKTAWSNLRFAFPAFDYRTLRWIVKVYFGRFSLGALELLEFYARRKNPRWILDRFEVRGAEPFFKCRSDGRPLIILSAHQGHWEGAAMVLGTRFPKDTAVLVKRQSPEWFFEALQNLRRAYAITTFDIETEILKAAHWLKMGKILIIVGDQGLGMKNPEAPFLGRTVPTPDAAFRLAVMAKAVVLPGLTHREKDKWILDAHPPLFDGASEGNYLPALRNWNDLLGRYIGRHPADYYWGFKRWKHCRERNVLLLHDGSPGGRDIVLEFAALLRGELPESVLTRDAGITFKNSARRLILQGLLGFRLDGVIPYFNLFPAFFKIDGEGILRFPCQTIVAYGREAVAAAAALKRLNGAKVIALTKPPPWAFPYVDLKITAGEGGRNAPAGSAP